MEQLIAGVDEVGVGPLAGPVVAAAVILSPDKKIYKLRDSKILTAKKREILYKKIMDEALSVGIGMASVEEIEELNIYHATLLAMKRAIENLSVKPQLVMIDGRAKPNMPLTIQTIVGGDKKVKCISAASIIAKVTRDNIMDDYHKQYPHYFFNLHKGYSTKKHQASIKEHGISKIHRRHFCFVKKYLDEINAK